MDLRLHLLNILLSAAHIYSWLNLLDILLSVLCILLLSSLPILAYITFSSGPIDNSYGQSIESKARGHLRTGRHIGLKVKEAAIGKAHHYYIHRPRLL